MRSWKFFLPLLASSLCFASQPDRIPAAIDSSNMVALAKSHHPQAQPKNDQGPVDPSVKLTYITMLMTPSPAQQKALDELLAEQQDRNSPYYHQWLTPQQYAERFGLSPNDLAKVTTWLSSQGFQILRVGGSRNSISFSGTAAQAEKAFQTEIHNYKVNGQIHFANATPLMIPGALSGIVGSVMGLHSFTPRPASQFRGRGTASTPRPDYYLGGYVFPNFLAPGDIATIYDIDPLYNAGTPIDGSGQALGIIGETDVYLADLNDFRAGFNLNQISGCTLNGSGVITACNSTYFQYVPIGSDPGTTYPCGDLSEADLDLEWSGAVARNAQIVFFNSPVVYDSSCNILSGGGVFTALTTAIDPSSGPILAPVLSMSYGSCEASLGGTSLESVLQQANAEGITVMNSSGDQAAASCDYSPPNNAVNPPYSPAEYGYAVSYPASSPEVTGVGGTSISLANDSYPNPATAYWSTGNAGDGGSALQYIPEQPWNDDEAFADYCHAPAAGDKFCSQGGSTAETGWVPLTTSATASQVQTDIWISGGGGGASNCFYVNGSDVCLGAGAGPSGGGFAQPTYQQSLSVSGAPAGVRYVPDVSLLASPNFPGYIFCTPLSEVENTTSTASTCASGISTALTTYGSIVGGTSASSPVFAGMVTLLNQYLGTAGLGNINPTLYSLAAARTTNDAFHSPVTSGDNHVYCTANTPSGYPSNVLCPGSGVLGYSAANFDATTGYNLVNGLGSVDLDKLAIAWAASRTTGSTIVITSSPSTGINAGQSATFSVAVTPSSGVGSVSFSTLNNGTTTVLGSATLNTPYGSATAGTATFTTTSLPVGTNMVTATYQGDSSVTSSTSAAVSVTVTQPDFMFPASVTFSPASVPAGQSTSTQLTLTPVVGSATVNFTPSSCSGLPTGATCSFNPSSVTFGGVTPVGTTTVTITTAANMTVPSGAETVTITGSVSTGGPPHTTAGSFTITATNQSFTLAPSSGAATFSVNAGTPVSISFTVTGAGSPTAFSPSALPVTYTCSQSTLPSQSSCSWSPSGGSAVSANTVTLTVATTGPTSQLRTPLSPSTRLFYALLLPGMFGIVFASAGRKHGARLLALIIVLGASTLWLGSCGGSSNSSQNNGGTPAGSYSIVVNATTAGPNPLTATYTVKLTVTN